MANKTKAEKAAEALKAKAIELSGLSVEAFAALSDDDRVGFASKAQEAIDAEVKRIAEEKTAAKESEVDNSHLVVVTKDGVELAVHPTTLDAHRAAGWR